MRKIAFYALLSLATLVVAVTGVSGVNASKTTPHHISGILPGTVTFVELPFSDITDPYYQVTGLSVVLGPAEESWEFERIRFPPSHPVSK